MSERHVGGIEFKPYELTAEQLAKEHLKLIYERYGDDPRVIVANLDAILKEHGHDCIEYGLELADIGAQLGPVDMFEAYSAGYEHGRTEGKQ